MKQQPLHSRENNFDFIRLLFATFVIVSHSYPITGSTSCDWLCQLSSGQVILSYIGVKGFFILSGYLIFQSMERSKTVLDYFAKRILRLYPALIVVLLLTMGILVPIVYQGEVPFYTHPLFWSYLWDNLSLYYTQYYINGVFEHNPLPNVINGSLWTIAYEFTMYVFISLFMVIRSQKKLMNFLLLLLVMVLAGINLVADKQTLKAIHFWVLDIELLLDLSTFFLVGSLFAALKIERIQYKYSLTAISFVLLAASLWLGLFEYVKYITLPVIVILFGLSSTRYINRIGDQIGDVSYGIYIYAFPIQQVLVYALHIANPIGLTVLSFVLTAIVSYGSWHIIEKPALKLKSYLKPS